MIDFQPESKAAHLIAGYVAVVGELDEEVDELSTDLSSAVSVRKRYLPPSLRHPRRSYHENPHAQRDP